MFEFDKFYLRRLSMHVVRKTLYVISKQMLTIFTVSHVIGLWFYLMTMAIIDQTDICSGANTGSTFVAT